MTTTTSQTVSAKLAGTLHRTLEPIHVVAYFAPEVFDGWKDLGLHPQLAYFAGRSAAMGAVNPGVTVSTFYVFAPRIVELAIPGFWAVASPEQVLVARHENVTKALERTVGRPDTLAEAYDLAKRACAGLTAPGRALYAAHAALPWPTDPLLGLWHAQTLLREHRGDGHVAALVNAQLDPVESILTYGQVAGTTDFLKMTRGWTQEEWDAAATRLQARDIVDPDGLLTDTGRAVRGAVEEQTQRTAMEGWDALGLAGCERLLELVLPMRESLAQSGLFPTSLVAPST